MPRAAALEKPPPLGIDLDTAVRFAEEGLFFQSVADAFEFVSRASGGDAETDRALAAQLLANINSIDIEDVAFLADEQRFGGDVLQELETIAIGDGYENERERREMLGLPPPEDAPELPFDEPSGAEPDSSDDEQWGVGAQEPEVVEFA